MNSPHLPLGFAGRRLPCLLLFLALSSPGISATAPTNTVMLDPFTVSTNTNRGYAATNSLSATRVNTPVSEIPATINIVTREFMSDFGRDTVEQALQGVTGVANRARNEGHFQEFFMIRGFNSTLNLRNRVPYSAFTDASFVEQVEVVKGPQTVLYGLADPGGLVNIITKKPLATPRGYVMAKVGSEDFWRGEFDTTGPVLPDKSLLYRLTGSWEESESWLKNGFWEQQFITPAVTWLPFEKTKVNLEYTYQHRHHAFQRPSLPNDAATTRRVVNNRFFSTITPDDDATNVGQSFELSLTQRIGDRVTLQATAADVDRNTDMFNYVGASAAPVTTGGVITGYRFVPNPNLEEWSNHGRHYYVDLNIGSLSFAGTKHNLVLGFQQDETDSGTYTWRTVDPNAAFDPLAPPAEIRLSFSRAALRARNDLRQGSPSAARNRGYFIIDQMKAFNDRLSLLGGVRRDELSVGGSRNTPQLGATFKLARGINLFGLYSESFVPNASRLDAGLGVVRDFPPTESEGFDAGVKIELLEGRVAGAISIFQIERANLVQAIATFPPPVGTPQFFLSGLEGSEGVEVELFFTPGPAWQVIAGYTYTDARILESNRATDVGLRLAQTSPHSFNLTSRYSFLRGPLKGFSVGALLIHRQGPIPDFSTFAQRQIVGPGWTRLDAFVAYETKLFGRTTRFALNVNNTTDETYIERVGMYNAPRQVFFQTRVSF